jgi:hypothetical protein
MTVQAGVEISLELLVGEMEELGCEHVQHVTHKAVHNGPATHYSRRECKFCGDVGEVEAVCQPYTDHVAQGRPLQCMVCLEQGPAQQIRKILAPVKS